MLCILHAKNQVKSETFLKNLTFCPAKLLNITEINWKDCCIHMKKRFILVSSLLIDQVA